MKAVSAEGAPKAIGPYSQAIAANGFVFTAGQIALDPKTGELVPGGIREQTQKALENLEAVLEAAGTGKDRIVKTTVYLKDMGDFSVMNEVYAKFFAGHKPARSTIQAAHLPKDALFEIDAVAVLKD